MSKMINDGIKKDILGTMGNTPLVRLNKVATGIQSEIIAKCEFFNPGGSVKDRIGIAMIEDAERTGKLKPGGTIVECTSGNTGMGLAIASAIKGYKCIFVMPDKMSAEKIRNLRAFGAKVVITPTAVEADDPRSYYSVARRLAQETPNAMHMNQYDNLSNRDAHYRTTGPELYEQLGGKFDAFVAGMGTGGTITGVAKALKERDKKIQIVGVDPIGSILFDYFKTGKKVQAHSYKVEGIGEDIIPLNYDFKVIDEMVQITDKESFQMTRKLLTQEGLFVGVSAGAAVCGAIQYAKQIEKAGSGPKRIVVLLPDSGNRYLSKVFEDDWMRENGFLEDGKGSVEDLLTALNRSESIITASPTDQVESIINTMRDKGISQIPVVSKGEVTGLVSENSLLTSLFNGKIRRNDAIGPVAENNFVIVSRSGDIDRVMQSISGGQTPLVVENGKVVAIITKIDLISYLGSKNK